MPDELESFMDTMWEDIEAGVTAGLAASADHRIDTVVDVSIPSAGTPYRVTTGWGPARKAGRATLRQLTVDVTDRAFRYRATHGLDLAHGATSDRDSLRDTALRFGRDTARDETAAVLDLLHRSRPRRAKAPSLTPAAVQAAARRLGGGCRLVTSGQDGRKLVDHAQVAEHAVLPRSAMPRDVSGVLVATLAGGPRIERLGGSLALTWARTGSRTAELALTSDFFLHRPGASAFFV